MMYGNITGTTLAFVKIECNDCHGTPSQFPWELPLGEIKAGPFGLGFFITATHFAVVLSS
jgi:hypothetical protein